MRFNLYYYTYIPLILVPTVKNYDIRDSMRKGNKSNKSCKKLLVYFILKLPTFSIILATLLVIEFLFD